ncbi:MAG: hypothetical protein U9Q06_03795 [Nanoarchaeota archaeon]|nr:hypothetical protein [Nanoarchaeota archaeon]
MAGNLKQYKLVAEREYKEDGSSHLVQGIYMRGNDKKWERIELSQEEPLLVGMALMTEMIRQKETMAYTHTLEAVVTKFFFRDDSRVK